MNACSMCRKCSTSPLYKYSVASNSSSFFTRLSASRTKFRESSGINQLATHCRCIYRLPLHKIARLIPRASAVVELMLSTIRCFIFFRMMSKLLPCFGSACNLLKLMATSSFADCIIFATSTLVFPFTDSPLTPTSSSPDCRVPSLDAGVLSNTYLHQISASLKLFKITNLT